MPWEVKKLTPYQVRYIVGHARNDHGMVLPQIVGSGGPETEEEFLKRHWRERYKLNDVQCERKWQEFLRVEGLRAHLEGRHPPLAPEEIDAQVLEFERKVQWE